MWRCDSGIWRWLYKDRFLIIRFCKFLRKFRNIFGIFVCELRFIYLYCSNWWYELNEFYSVNVEYWKFDVWCNYLRFFIYVINIC